MCALCAEGAILPLLSSEGLHILWWKCRAFRASPRACVRRLSYLHYSPAPQNTCQGRAHLPSGLLLHACTHCTLTLEKVCRLSLGRRAARGVFAHLHTLHTFFHFTRAAVGRGYEIVNAPHDGRVGVLRVSHFFLSLLSLGVQKHRIRRF